MSDEKCPYCQLDDTFLVARDYDGVKIIGCRRCEEYSRIEELKNTLFGNIETFSWADLDGKTVQLSYGVDYGTEDDAIEVLAAHDKTENKMYVLATKKLTLDEVAAIKGLKRMEAEKPEGIVPYPKFTASQIVPYPKFTAPQIVPYPKFTAPQIVHYPDSKVRFTPRPESIARLNLGEYLSKSEDSE